MDEVEGESLVDNGESTDDSDQEYGEHETDDGRRNQRYNLRPCPNQKVQFY